MTEKQEYILEKYYRYLKLSGVNKLGSTKIGFKHLFKYLNELDIDFLNLKISQAQDFQTYLMMMTDDNGDVHYTKESVITMINRTSRFYNYLMKEKLILSNPFLEIKKINSPRSLPKNILPEEDVNKLLNYLKEFWKQDNRDRRRYYKVHVISELMYSTGMRMHEVRNLKVNDIDLDQGMVKVTDTKTRTERFGLLNEYASKVLRLYIKKLKKYVFFGNTEYKDLLFGSNVSIYTMVNKTLDEACRKLKIKRITSHGFRHCLGYHFLRAGCDIRYIQKILGHRSLTSTQIYTKVDKEDLRFVLDKFHPRKFRRRKNHES